MDVNSARKPARSPLPSPPTLDARALQVLVTLGHPSTVATDDPDLFRRVRTFIVCNGYEGVLRAAHYTASRSAKREIGEDIGEPWPYTVRVFNNNLARMSHLYVLTHWAESGLRSQVDLRLTRPFGAAWYRFPERYLSAGRVQYFWGDAAHRELRWETDRAAAAGKRVADYGSGAAFLDQISMGWLVNIVVYSYEGHLGRFLVAASGDLVILTEAASLLDAAKKARNAVAHNRYLKNDEYREASAKLLRLLNALQFDVAKALLRVEAARRGVLGRALRDLNAGALPPRDRGSADILGTKED
jgi:hypothetical protein